MIKMNDKIKSITVYCTFEQVLEIDDDMTMEEIEKFANDFIASDEMLEDVVNSGFYINSD